MFNFLRWFYIFLINWWLLSYWVAFSEFFSILLPWFDSSMYLINFFEMRITLIVKYQIITHCQNISKAMCQLYIYLGFSMYSKHSSYRDSICTMFSIHWASYCPSKLIPKCIMHTNIWLIVHFDIICTV